MIELTINGNTGSFKSENGFYSATDIANTLGLPMPSQWRNRNSVHYRNTGDLVKVQGARSVHSSSHSQGTWMTEECLYAWAQDIDTKFRHRIVPILKALVHGDPEEAHDIASSVVQYDEQTDV